VVAVDRALEQYGAPVYVWHEIVHNEYVVESLERKGAVFAERTEKVPKRAMVMFSAHGVAPTVHGEAAKRRLATIDATWEKTTFAGPEEMRRHQRAEAAEAEKVPVVHPDRGGAR
jgi:4-hydroxy-3-methylbut-2-enyl diphosphate reductase